MAQPWRSATPRKVGLKHGFRSGLEENNATVLKKAGQPVVFEKVKIEFLTPAELHIYTPDFELKNGIIVETKGLFENADRAKHLYVKLEHPALDIRFVFQNPNARLSKTSKVTYAQWADSYGFKWAAKVIPAAWWGEPNISGPRGPRTIAIPEAAKDLIAGSARQPQRAGRNKAMRPPKVAGAKARPA
jgi:hypothetical protein